MKRSYGLFLVVALALAGLVSGCGDKSTSLEVGGGAGPLAAATPVGVDKCYNCHANTAVGGTRIFDAWGGSRHANLDNSYDAYDNLVNLQSRWWHGSRPGYDPEEQDVCGRCHNPTEDALNLAFYVGPGSGTAPRFVVGCEACHGGGSLHFGVGPIGGPKLGEFAKPATAGQSSQYNTCTQCHGVEAPLFHSTSPYRLINDTHNDNVNRTYTPVTDIQGYVIRKSVDTACVDCHNPHSANMNGSINRQWKESAHGDFAGEAWKHYQWTLASRQSCQRCHTATGAMNYLNDPANYDQTKNVFSWLGDPATDHRSEMLYCYACHTDYYGGLRNPGPITAPYTGAPHTYPDVAGANICLSCHTGRESGGSIKASTASFDNTGFINSHYLTAGGTVFAATGYEYEGRDYEIVRVLAHDEGDKHDLIGTGVETGEPIFDAVRQNYVNGPCVSCHFGSTDPNRLNPLTRYSDNTLSHTLSPLTRYADNDLALNPVCVNCHTTRGQGSNAGILWLGDDNTAATLQGTTHKARYQAALEALKVELAQSGFYFASTHPYFFKTPDNTASSNAVRNWWSPDNTTLTGMNNMGAAFNYNLLAHDPGGVAHNRRYTRRLIYDAIDWLDDGILNYSVNVTLTSAPHLGAVYQASAISYLLAAQTGTAADRY